MVRVCRLSALPPIIPLDRGASMDETATDWGRLANLFKLSNPPIAPIDSK